MVHGGYGGSKPRKPSLGWHHFPRGPSIAAERQEAEAASTIQRNVRGWAISPWWGYLVVN